MLAEIAQTEEDMYLRQELAMCFKFTSGEFDFGTALHDVR